MTRHHSPPPAATRRSLRARDQSGAALVEFALVISLFAFVLYGLIAFGMILATKQSVTNAASEAARAAVGSATDADAKLVANARVEKALGVANGRYTIGPGVNEPSTGPCNPLVPTGAQCITVIITYDLDGHPIVPPAPGLGLVTPPSLTSKAVVQYR